MKRDTVNLVTLLGVAGLLTTGTAGATNLFSVSEVTPDHWTQIAGADKDKGKTEGAEASCGAGTCSAEKKAEGDKKGAEHSCGAGSCSAEKKDGDKKGAEHSCGAGSCSGDKKGA